jgi:ADP-heptose:LPS heptosyltransferase
MLESVLQRIIENNEKKEKDDPRRVLIIIWPSKFYLGDNCLLLSHLRFVSSFFKDATLDINYPDRYAEYVDLLENNPFVNDLINQEWIDIDFNRYDMIMLLHPQEQFFLEFLAGHYGDRIAENRFNPRIYSFSASIDRKSAPIFPVYQTLNEFIDERYADGPLHEFFISDEEKNWGNAWLEDEGVGKDDKVIVLLDEAASGHKLLKTHVYFEVVNYFLRFQNVKLLIFDKKAMGKAGFYKAWLGDAGSEKIICAREMPLRKSLCILSSKYIKVVFGPCTGLLHCAAGVCGALMNSGQEVTHTPLVIVYTGKYPPFEGTAFTWWGRSMVNCWVLKKGKNGSKEVTHLRDVGTEEALKAEETLWCSEYDASLILRQLKLYNDQFSQRLN